MIEPLFDTCLQCGHPAYKPGAGLCWRHEIESLIAESAERMRERLKRVSVPPLTGDTSSPMNAQDRMDRQLQPGESK